MSQSIQTEVTKINTLVIVKNSFAHQADGSTVSQNCHFVLVAIACNFQLNWSTLKTAFMSWQFETIIHLRFQSLSSRQLIYQLFCNHLTSKTVFVDSTDLFYLHSLTASLNIIIVSSTLLLTILINNHQRVKRNTRKNTTNGISFIQLFIPVHFTSIFYNL